MPQKFAGCDAKERLPTGDDGPVLPSRSALMSRVGGKNTKPEIAVRKLIRILGHRFRLHVRGLPGTPDIVFPAQKKAIFVHGCFWHRHPKCVRTTWPKTRSSYWAAKFDANVKRDRRNRSALRRAGWQVLVVWECETFKSDRLLPRLTRFLGNSRRIR